MLGKIFIQIASYRDPQLIPTILDCIKKAANPELLQFCIAWQHAPEESIDALRVFKNIEIIDIPYLESKGACWARNTIQQRYRGEEYTLQLDSHHRFVPEWDRILKKMYQRLKLYYPKPLLTTYGTAFDPETSPSAWGKAPYQLNFDRFIPEGAIFFMPGTVENWKDYRDPLPARFYSGHFCFTGGSFCTEVPHDPNYYFHGEEISIAARAYTHGYDLFTPHRLILWHEFTRKGRSKHWDDHVQPNTYTWFQRNTDCHKRNRCLFSMDGESYDSVDWGPYGFGTVRTLRDYEKYAGINFQLRSVQKDTLDNKLPPNKKIHSEEDWLKSFLKEAQFDIKVKWESLSRSDYDFLCVVFEREDGSTILRRDVSDEELNTLLSSKSSNHEYATISRTFFCEATPKRWVVIPHSKKSGWGERISQDLY